VTGSPSHPERGVRHWAKLGLVSCGGLGLAPVAPGTFGTLGGVALAWGLARTEHFLLWTVLAIGVVYLIGLALASFAEQHAGKKDPGFFVLDEVAGYLVVCLWDKGPSALTLVVAFILFRFFDVLKPPPLRRLERIGGGHGILLDDIGAGIYGFALLAVLRMFLLDPSVWGA